LILITTKFLTSIQPRSILIAKCLTLILRTKCQTLIQPWSNLDPKNNKMSSLDPTLILRTTKCQTLIQPWSNLDPKNNKMSNLYPNNNKKSYLDPTLRTSRTFLPSSAAVLSAAKYRSQTSKRQNDLKGERTIWKSQSGKCTELKCDIIGFEKLKSGDQFSQIS
jgi:hypothetical protein